jgi:hypothetical protein
MLEWSAKRLTAIRTLRIIFRRVFGEFFVGDGTLVLTSSRILAKRNLVLGTQHGQW